MNLKEQQNPIHLRIFRRLFGMRRKITKVPMEEEPMKTPLRLIVERFWSNKTAMAGLTVFVVLFGAVMILPVFFPLKLSYQEVTQQNVSPGRTMLSYPKQLEGNVKKIAVGATYSVGINEQGEMYLWGKYPKSLKTTPEGMGMVKDVSAGRNHILALSEDGRLYAWGSNRFHQLEIPEEVKRLPGSPQLYAGNQYSMVVTEDGTVYCWGNRNLLDYYVEPWQGQVKKVAANTSTVLALLDDGTVKALGRRESGLTEIPQMRQVTDLAVTASSAYAVTADGTLYQWGSTEESFDEIMYQMLVGEKIVSLQAGRYHVTALTNQGRVFCFGENGQGQCDVPKWKNNQKIQAVYSGYYQNYAVLMDGKIEAWGLKGYLLGTDGYGRDILTRLLHGGRLTMTIGACSVLIQTIIGVVIGGIAGYFGGRIDNLLMRFTEVVNALPFLPFAMILSAMIGNRLTQMQRIYMIMIVLGVLSWTGMARLVRAQVLSEKNKEFVTAAQAAGLGRMRIIFRHIMPNVISYVIVSAAASFAASMLTESSLSFLGFGVIEPSPTWGNMLTGAQSSIVIRVYWWRWVFPALALSLATISINLIGDGLRYAMDPKSER